MAVEVKVPVLGESVSEATVAKWFKNAGDAVAVDEPIVELETDKVTVEVNAPVAGALASVIATEGTDVEVGALLGTIEEGASGSESAPAPAAEPAPEPAPAAAAEAPAAAPAAKAEPAAPGPSPVGTWHIRFHSHTGRSAAAGGAGDGGVDRPCSSSTSKAITKVSARSRARAAVR